MSSRPKIPPGKGQMKVLGNFHVPGFDGTRTVRIFLPRGHGQSGPHRVFYMFDGQNVFDDAGSFAGGWHLHTLADRLARVGKPAPVFVGIDHGHHKRMEELSPYATRFGAGRADAFIDGVIRSVFPAVANEASVIPGPHGAIIGGSSLGGMAAFYAHFSRPEVFGAAMCMSPSFWVGGAKMFEWMQSVSNPWTSRVYLDAGAREGGMLKLAERMALYLRTRDYPESKLMWRPDSRGTHSEKHWARRAPKAVRFMLK